MLVVWMEEGRQVFLRFFCVCVHFYVYVSKQIHVNVFMYIKVSGLLLGFSTASGSGEVWDGAVLEAGGPVGNRCHCCILTDVNVV